MKLVRFRSTAMALALFVASVFFAQPSRACTGDCNGDGEVTINELISMVNIALGSSPLSSCAIGDANGDGEITINEIIQAVNFALSGCPTQCTGAAIRISLAFDPDAVPELAGVSLSVRFSSADLSLPEDTASRIEELGSGGGFFDAQVLPRPGEPRDNELRISYLAQESIPPGPFLNVLADCTGATIPSPDSLECSVTGASDSGGFDVPGEVRCTLEIQPR
jgi:hypothetical protein